MWPQIAPPCTDRTWHKLKNVRCEPRYAIRVTIRQKCYLKMCMFLLCSPKFPKDVHLGIHLYKMWLEGGSRTYLPTPTPSRCILCSLTRRCISRLISLCILTHFLSQTSLGRWGVTSELTVVQSEWPANLPARGLCVLTSRPNMTMVLTCAPQVRLTASYGQSSTHNDSLILQWKGTPKLLTQTHVFANSSGVGSRLIIGKSFWSENQNPSNKINVVIDQIAIF